VIGVAKTAFQAATHAMPVLRGTSARPLFVTAAGMSRDEAANLVRHMSGRHRLPDAMRRAAPRRHTRTHGPARRQTRRKATPLTKRGSRHESALVRMAAPVMLWAGSECRCDPRTSHPPDPGGTGRRPEAAVLLARRRHRARTGR
jgi:hypothetical protein